MADALGAKGIDGIQKVQLLVGTKALEGFCSESFYDHDEEQRRVEMSILSEYTGVSTALDRIVLMVK